MDSCSQSFQWVATGLLRDHLVEWTYLTLKRCCNQTGWKLVYFVCLLRLWYSLVYRGWCGCDQRAVILTSKSFFSATLETRSTRAQNQPSKQRLPFFPIRFLFIVPQWDPVKRFFFSSTSACTLWRWHDGSYYIEMLWRLSRRIRIRGLSLALFQCC